MSRKVKRHKTPKKKKQEAAAVLPPLKQEKAALRPPAGMEKWLLFLIGFLLYAQCIPYQHALDDKLYITHNTFTKKGISGIPELISNDLLVGFYNKKTNYLAGGRYRPFTLMTYALEWQFFGLCDQDKYPPGSQAYNDRVDAMAHFGHFVNAVCYGLCGLVLYMVLCALFPPGGTKNRWLAFPFVVALLYLAHPLHTEVVANIKGRDDLFSLLGSLLALLLITRWLEKRMMADLLLSGLCFLTGFFSKEITATMLAVIPLTLWFFTKHNIKDIVIASLPLAVAIGVGIVIRTAVIGGAHTDPVPELMNDPFLYVSESPGSKMATIFFMIALYFKLLVFPHPLTHDYYPWHPIAPDGWHWGQAYPYPGWSNPIALCGLLLFVALFIYAIWGTFKKKPGAYAFWVFFFPFILFSNLFFSVGIFMNERFLFIPSLGFCFILGWWISNKLAKGKNGNNLAFLVFLGFALFFSVKTVLRNPAWYNDRTLATTDVEVSVNSAKNNMSAGGGFVEMAKRTQSDQEKQALIGKAIGHLKRALELYPNYYQPMDILGNAYFVAGDYDSSIDWFVKCLKLKPKYPVALANLEIIGNNARNNKQPDIAIKAYNALLKELVKPELKGRILGYLGEVYGKDKHDLEKSISYLEKALKADPGNTDNLQKIGVAYAMSGRPVKGIEYFNKVLEKQPDNGNVIMNLGVAWQALGDTAKAGQYLRKAKELGAMTPNN